MEIGHFQILIRKVFFCNFDQMCVMCKKQYLCLLRELVKDAVANGDDVAAARAALQEAARLVEIPNAGGRYSSKVLPEPNRVLEIRARIAEAIEGLRAHK